MVQNIANDTVVLYIDEAPDQTLVAHASFTSGPWIANPEAARTQDTIFIRIATAGGTRVVSVRAGAIEIDRAAYPADATPLPLSPASEGDVADMERRVGPFVDSQPAPPIPPTPPA